MEKSINTNSIILYPPDLCPKILMWVNRLEKGIDVGKLQVANYGCEDSGLYRLIKGKKRLAAYKLLGIEQVLCEII